MRSLEGNTRPSILIISRLMKLNHICAWIKSEYAVVCIELTRA